MSESPLFKRAFVRGLNAELTRNGVTLYPSKEAADFAADFVADNVGLPDPISQTDAITEKVAFEVCETLVKVAQELCERAGNVYDEGLSKTAASADPSDIALADAWSLMEKAAAETGSLSQGGDAPNTLAAAAKDNSESALEMNRRPEEYAHLGERGMGGYENKGRGAVGVEEKSPVAPKATGKGSNSATENTAKHAGLAGIVRKAASEMGSLMTPGQDANTLAAAASHNGEAALEMKRRPEGYAHVGEDAVGQTRMHVPPGAVVGREMPHPEAPAASAAGSNSVIAATKSAFDQLFEQTAHDVIGYLPEKMAEQQKVAHIRVMMGLENPERADYLRDLYVNLGTNKEAAALVHEHYMKTAAVKTAGMENLPPALREKAMEKKEKAKPFAGKETPEEEAAEHKMMMKEKGEKEEKEEKGEKEASARTLSSLRQALSRLNA